MTPLPHGCYPASVTPLNPEGSLDLAGLARVLAWFTSAGCAGVVIAGTNGEGPSLSAVEKRDLVRTAVPLAGQLQVVLGIATPSSDEAVWLCKQAHAAGAGAALLMPPAYFRDASEAGIEAWFNDVMARSPLGVLVYNLPKRTGFTFSAELISRLAKHENMIGVKDSSGAVENITGYAQALASTGKNLFVGDETLLLDALNAGWNGTISGAANLLAMWLSQVVSEWPADRESAETKFQYILPAIQALRKPPQPAINKALLHRAGVLPDPAVRLPLLPASTEASSAAWSAIHSLLPRP